MDKNAQATGAFSTNILAENTRATHTSSANSNYVSISFSANKSNPIYGNSNTVQPPAIVLIPQIKY